MLASTGWRKHRSLGIGLKEVDLESGCHPKTDFAFEEFQELAGMQSPERIIRVRSFYLRLVQRYGRAKNGWEGISTPWSITL